MGYAAQLKVVWQSRYVPMHGGGQACTANVQHAKLSLQPPEVSLTVFVQGHYESNWPAWQMHHVDSSAWTCGARPAVCTCMQRSFSRHPGTWALWH